MASSVNNSTSSDGSASPGTDGSSSSSSSRSSIASSGSSIASVGSGESVSSTSTAATTPVDDSPVEIPPFGAQCAAALNADTKAKLPALALDVNTKATTAIDKIKTVIAPNAITRSLVPAGWKSGSVRTIGMAEHREAALTLAHAFAADDYARYLVVGDGVAPGIAGGGGDGRVDDAAGVDLSEEKQGGVRGLKKSDEERKWKLHVDILTYTVASHCLGGLVTAVGPECDSVALWYVLFLSFPASLTQWKRP